MFYNYVEMFEPVITILCPEFGEEHKIFKMTIVTEPEQYDIGLISQAQSFCEMLEEIFIEDLEEDDVLVEFNGNPEFFPSNDTQQSSKPKKEDDNNSQLIGDTLYMMDPMQAEVDIDDFIVCDYSVSFLSELVCLFSTISLDDPDNRQITRAH